MRNSNYYYRTLTENLVVWIAGFSLSLKVDSYNVNIGGLITECCRQFQAFTLSLYPISPKGRRFKPPSSWFPASCQHFIGGYLWEVRSLIEVQLYGRVMQLSLLFNGRSCGFRIKIHPHNNLLLPLCQ